MTTYNCTVVAASANVRPSPNTSNSALTVWANSTAFQISEIVPDSNDPNNTAKKWGKILGGTYDGKYIALEYPGTPAHRCDYVPVLIPPPTTPPTYQITELEVVEVVKDSNGVITKLPMRIFVPKV